MGIHKIVLNTFVLVLFFAFSIVVSFSKVSEDCAVRFQIEIEESHKAARNFDKN